MGPLPLAVTHYENELTGPGKMPVLLNFSCLDVVGSVMEVRKIPVAQLALLLINVEL